MKKTILVFALVAAVASAGCFGFEHTSTPTQPTSGSASALMGTWSSAAVVPSASSCTDFKWNATEQSGTTAKGSFSATCANDVKVTGTAQGTLGNGTVTWSANGNAAASNQAACTFALNGTAELGVDSIRVPYSGTVCSVEVKGVEVLKKG